MTRSRFKNLLLAASLTALGTVAAADTLRLGAPQLVGISGFRSMWDESVPLAADGTVEYTDSVIKDRHPSAIWHPSRRGGQPGPIAFDALQRSILVRFPGAAEAIAERLAKGGRIAKVELILPFRDTELWPQHGRDLWDPATGGYNARRNWGVDKMYRESPPNWHAVAWALKKPWDTTDPALAPTYNAYIQGAGYWRHSGAQAVDHDRLGTRFGPTEVSVHQPEGRMDITAMVADPNFGASLGERLRRLADCGLLIRKWETYDHRFFNGVYEWATAAGGRAILIDTPTLEVTFAEGRTEVGELPPAADVAALADQLRQSGQGGQPAARLLSEEELLAFNERMMAKPDWMPDWQYERIGELRHLRTLERKREPEFGDDMFFDIFLNHHVIYNMYGSRQRIQGKGSVAVPAPPYARYKAWVDQLLSRQPRGWSGFEAGKAMAEYYTYGEALPQPARDAIQAYWTAWLMPERETAPAAEHRQYNSASGKLIHPMADQLWGPKDKEQGKGGTETYVADTYYRLTGDWQGNKSFYRSGFNYTISTQNFNTTASAGALLGGAIIGAPLPIADGRHGFRNYPLGLWAWKNGSSQEHIDHYYYSITLSGNKAVFDFGPTLYDRMLGRSVIAYNLEELIGAWHPGLRRFIAPSSRTSLEHLLVATDGIQEILHTLSPRGALFDFNEPQHVPKGMKLIGQEVNPEIVALQATTQPWADAYLANLVDDKPLPFYATHLNDGAWRRAYFGRHFGLSSVDGQAGRIQLMAQWRRGDQPVRRNTELGTMDIRMGYNETQFASTAGGYLGRPGATQPLQHRNKLIVLTSPAHLWHGPKGVGWAGDGTARDIHSIQTSAILFNFEQPPTWEIFIGDTKVDSLPATARQGVPICIRDGNTFIGLLPFVATDLGRDIEVELKPGTTQRFGEAEITAALIIDSYLLRRDTPLAHDADDFEAIDAACGGLAVELHDAEDFADFAAFRRHMAAVRVEQTFAPANHLQSVVYHSGTDRLEASAFTIPPAQEEGETQNALLMRRINGEAAYPPDGILRQTDTAMIGTTGQLSRGGATLDHRPTAPAYLLHEPKSNTYRAMIPTPEASWLHLRLPDGRQLRTDGRINLFDATVHADGSVDLWQAVNPEIDQLDDSFANAVVFAGTQASPSVTLNGTRLEPTPLVIEGQTAWAVPINGRTTIPDAAVIARRLAVPE